MKSCWPNNISGDQFGIDTGYFAYPFGERASRDFENRLLNDCDLKLLLGINDQLKNTALKYDWERVGMEEGVCTKFNGIQCEKSL